MDGFTACPERASLPTTWAPNQKQPKQHQNTPNSLQLGRETIKIRDLLAMGLRFPWDSGRNEAIEHII